MKTNVQINVSGAILPANLVKAPDNNNNGLVILCHGSGSNIRSYRNNAVAKYYQANGVSTLLFNLLTEDEDHIYHNRFDANLHTQRIKYVTNWVSDQSDLKNLPLGYFTAGTTFPSTVESANSYPGSIKAIVCKGLNTLHHTPHLEQVNCPTLLIAGGLNANHVKINKDTYHKLTCKKELRIIEGASQQFEESGKLQELARHSLDWFKSHFNS